MLNNTRQVAASDGLKYIYKFCVSMLAGAILTILIFKEPLAHLLHHAVALPTPALIIHASPGPEDQFSARPVSILSAVMGFVMSECRKSG